MAKRLFWRVRMIGLKINVIFDGGKIKPRGGSAHVSAMICGA